LNGDSEKANSEVASLPLDSLRPEEKKLIEPWIQS